MEFFLKLIETDKEKVTVTILSKQVEIFVVGINNNVIGI